jgi:hypothetical protein
MVIVALGFSLLGIPAAAQDSAVTVPDVTGLSVPEAAAMLNANGLRLGAEIAEEWSEASGLGTNTIRAQAIAPGELVERGTVVDVMVLRSPNVILIYNRNQFSLINGTGAELDLRGLRFEAVDNAAAYNAGDLAPSLAPGNRCIQLWATPRTGPDRPPGCEGVQNWRSTANSGAHFWTDSNGVTQFRVLQDGLERALCPGAVQGEGMKQCAFYVATNAASSDVTPYIYLAYTAESLVVLNQSTDLWMPVGNTTAINYNPTLPNPGHALTIGEPALFGNPDIVGDIRRLAPGQCLLFTHSDPADSPPQDCFVVARLDIDPAVIFWAADFEIVSATDGKAHKCLGATAGKLTICVMPR